MNKLQYVLQAWRDGVITTFEMQHLFFDRLTDLKGEGNLEELSLEDKLVSILVAYTDKLPSTDEGWKKLKIYHVGSCCCACKGCRSGDGCIYPRKQPDKNDRQDFRLAVERFREWRKQ